MLQSWMESLDLEQHGWVPGQPGLEELVLAGPEGAGAASCTGRAGEDWAEQLPYLGRKNGSLVSELEENWPPFPNSALFVGLLRISPMVLVLIRQHSAAAGVHRIPQLHKRWCRGV